MPSINQLSRDYKVSRDTVFKAFIDLKERGIIDSTPGKGYYVVNRHGLGGMAHGLPERMDGRILWATEPEGIPRMTERMDDRALRLKTLGNAVCPPQAYPIFRYIAMIENGTCGDFCPYGKEGDCL